MNRQSRNHIRVLHLIYPGAGVGGIEKWLLHILRSRDFARFQTDFAIPHGSYDVRPLYEPLGARVFEIPRAIHPFAHLRALRNLVHKHGPYDIVHSHVPYSGIELRLAYNFGVPVRIAHCHSSAEVLRDCPLPQRLALRLTQKWIQRYATHGLACSEKAAEGLFGPLWRSDGRWRVLHCGIDLGEFLRSPHSARELREQFALPVEGPIVGYVGRLSHEKNPKFLLEVARELVRTRPDVHFVLAGDGPLRGEIERLVNEYGLSAHVHLLGNVTNVPQLMRSLFDVMLLPSLYEGLGIVVIESQAAGLPAIVSEAVPAEAIVVPALVKRLPLALGPKHWAEKVLSTVACPRAISQEQALAAVSETDFNIERGISILQQFYNSALNGPF